MIAQPLTQLLRIHQENRIAAAEVASSRDDLKNAENEIALQVHTLYYGILVAQLQKKAAEQQTSYSAENLSENENNVRKGSALQVAALQSQAELLQGQQLVLTADLKIQDYMVELNDLLGLPLDTKLDLESEVDTNVRDAGESRVRERGLEGESRDTRRGGSSRESARRRILSKNGVHSRHHCICPPQLPGRCAILRPQLRDCRSKPELYTLGFRQAPG